MKFLRQISLCFVLVSALIFAAGATYCNVSYLPDMEEYEEIQSLLPEILPEVNEILEEEGYDIAIDSEDITLEEGYPIYLNENYFAPEIATPDDLLSLIKKQDHYVWKLPVNLGNQVMLIGLGKGYPVRKEVQESASAQLLAELNKNEGKWHLTTVEFVSGEAPYTQKIKDARINADQIVFVSGPAGSNIQMAICIDGEQFKDVLSLTDAEISVQTNKRSRKADDMIAFNEGKHYTYQELQESLGMVSEQMDGDRCNSGDTLLATGGGGSNHLISGSQTRNYWVVAIVSVLLLALVVLGIRKKNNTKGNI